jgi:pilus assembly protein CpaB
MKPMVLMVIALGCGLVAAFGVSQHMGSSSAATTESLSVAVASKEIDINEALSPENVQMVEWPGDQAPQGVILDLAQLEGMYARARLYPGEPILAGKIMDDSAAGSSVRIPEGYRAVSVKVALDSSVSNLIEPGDRVDVIAILRPTSRNPVGMAKTILKGVRVFAVNSNIVRSLDNDAPDEARAVSLLLTPEQAETLMMANEMGTIKLAMRSPDDENVQDTEGCTTDRVLGRSEAADTVGPLGELDLGREVEEIQPQPKKKKGENHWQTIISSPGSVHRYTFPTPGSIPQMEVLDSSQVNFQDAGGGDDLDGLSEDLEMADFSDDAE